MQQKVYCDDPTIVLWVCIQTSVCDLALTCIFWIEEFISAVYCPSHITLFILFPPRSNFDIHWLLRSCNALCIWDLRKNQSFCWYRCFAVLLCFDFAFVMFQDLQVQFKIVEKFFYSLCISPGRHKDSLKTLSGFPLTDFDADGIIFLSSMWMELFSFASSSKRSSPSRHDWDKQTS